jgi:hypothetical protein
MSEVCEPAGFDLIFVLDSSGSVTAREWRSQLATVVRIGPQLTAQDNLAVVTFATESQLAVGSQPFTPLVAELIETLPYQARRSFIDRGLRTALSVVNRTEVGFVARPTAVILITDGVGVNDSATFVAANAIIDSGALFVPVPLDPVDIGTIQRIFTLGSLVPSFLRLFRPATVMEILLAAEERFCAMTAPPPQFPVSTTDAPMIEPETGNAVAQDDKTGVHTATFFSVLSLEEAGSKSGGSRNFHVYLGDNKTEMDGLFSTVLPVGFTTLDTTVSGVLPFSMAYTSDTPPYSLTVSVNVDEATYDALWHAMSLGQLRVLAEPIPLGRVFSHAEVDSFSSSILTLHFDEPVVIAPGALHFYMESSERHVVMHGVQWLSSLTSTSEGAGDAVVYEVHGPAQAVQQAAALLPSAVATVMSQILAASEASSLYISLPVAAQGGSIAADASTKHKTSGPGGDVSRTRKFLTRQVIAALTVGIVTAGKQH